MKPPLDLPLLWGTGKVHVHYLNCTSVVKYTQRTWADKNIEDLDLNLAAIFCMYDNPEYYNNYSLTIASELGTGKVLIGLPTLLRILQKYNGKQNQPHLEEEFQNENQDFCCIVVSKTLCARVKWSFKMFPVAQIIDHTFYLYYVHTCTSSKAQFLWLWKWDWSTPIHTYCAQWRPLDSGCLWLLYSSAVTSVCCEWAKRGYNSPSIWRSGYSRKKHYAHLHNF